MKNDCKASVSLIEADANKQSSTPKEDWDHSATDPTDAQRAIREYLDVLDDAAFGAASEVEPKFTSHSDPSSQWTAAPIGGTMTKATDFVERASVQPHLNSGVMCARRNGGRRKNWGWRKRLPILKRAAVRWLSACRKLRRINREEIRF